MDGGKLRQKRKIDRKNEGMEWKKKERAEEG